MSDIETWYATAGGNDITGPPDFPKEGWAPANVNDCLREDMAAIRRWFNDPEWLNRNYLAAIAKVDDTHFTIAGVDATTWMTVGRRIKLVGATTGYGFVESSAFATNTTVTCTMDAAVMPVSLTRAYVHHSSSLARSSFTGAQPTGSYLAWGGAAASPPTGYLVCNGAEIAKATYNLLWVAFGAVQLYGTPSNPTLNFLLPDLRGKVLIGYHSGNDGDGDYGTVGGLYGAKTLAIADVASSDENANHRHVYFAGAVPNQGTSNQYDEALTTPNWKHTHNVRLPAVLSSTKHDNRQASLVSVILIKT